MAERATDLRDIERRLVARIVGEPEPGVPTPVRAVGPGGRGPRPRRHRRPRPRAGGRPGHRAGRADQPHRDHRPPARHPLRGRASSGVLEVEAGDALLVDGTTGDGRDRARPGRGAGAGRVRASATAPPTRRGRVPGRPPTALAVKILANVADGDSAVAAVGRSGRGRGPVPHRAVLPQPDRRADGRGAGRDLLLGARRLRRRSLRRRPHARRRLRQAGRLRHPRGRGEPGPRRARAPPLVLQPGADGPPAGRHRGRCRSRPAPRPG